MSRCHQKGQKRVGERDLSASSTNSFSSSWSPSLSQDPPKWFKNGSSGYEAFKPYFYPTEDYSISAVNQAPRNIPLKVSPPTETVQTTPLRTDPVKNHSSLKKPSKGPVTINLPDSPLTVKNSSLKAPLSGPVIKNLPNSHLNAPDLRIKSLRRKATAERSSPSTAQRQLNLESAPTPKKITLKRPLKGSDSEEERKRLRQIRFEQTTDSGEGESLDDYSRRRFQNQSPTIAVEDRGRHSKGRKGASPRIHRERSATRDRDYFRKYDTSSSSSDGDNGPRPSLSTTPSRSSSEDDARRLSTIMDRYRLPVDRDMGYVRQVEAPSREVEKVKSVIIDGYSVGRVFGVGRLDWKGIWICYNMLRTLGAPRIVVMIPLEKFNDDLAPNRGLIRKLERERVLWKIDDDDASFFILKTAERRDAALISNRVWKVVRNPPGYLLEVKDRTFPFEFKDESTINFLEASSGRFLEELLPNTL